MVYNIGFQVPAISSLGHCNFTSDRELSSSAWRLSCRVRRSLERTSANKAAKAKEPILPILIRYLENAKKTGNLYKFLCLRLLVREKCKSFTDIPYWVSCLMERCCVCITMTFVRGWIRTNRADTPALKTCQSTNTYISLQRALKIILCVKIIGFKLRV